MSLVGTRPPTVDEWDKYELHHRARLATKPGLTGMWQVSGRSNITDFILISKKKVRWEFTAFLSYAHYMPEQKKNQLRKRKILFLMSYREKMEKKIPQDKKTVL